MARSNENAPTISPVVGLGIAVAFLYFAKDLLIPVVFALFLAFLLSPVVERLESLRVPRIPAAALVLAFASAVVAVVGWIVADQVVQVVESLPKFSDNIRRKAEALQGQSKGLSQMISSLEDIGKQVTVSAPERPEARKKGLPRVEPNAPMPVEIVEQHSIVQAVRDYSGALLKPLGTVGLVLVFTLFMLIDRENMRNRLLRLMGQQKLQATTKAMDDAGHRVGRYVLMQFFVNAGFGVTIAIGLALLRVDSPILWGVLGIFLRFLPYLGPVLAWTMPFALTVASTDGWSTPLFVTGLFAVVELIIGNIVEPLLYGVHTGLSAVAILVSAAFWTVLWGPVGLVLSTPLTVCLNAIGRYSTQFEFLNVVLGDEPVLSPGILFYQRLLALDQSDALNILEVHAKERPLIAVFDEIVIPALAMAERDRHSGQLDARREDFVVQSINEFVTEMQEADAASLEGVKVRGTRVFCVPAHDTADEIAAAMCAHFLTKEGFPAIAFPVTKSPGQVIGSLSVQPDDVVCISAVPPFAASNARKVAKDIRDHGAEPRMIAGLWSTSASSATRIERLQKSLALIVATSLLDAVAESIAVDEARA